MDRAKSKVTLFGDFMLFGAMSVTSHAQEVVNRTTWRTLHHYNNTINNNMTSPVFQSANDVIEDDISNSSQIVDTISDSVTSKVSSLITTTAISSITSDVSVDEMSQNSDASILAKITALLVITAVVLVVSYRFVVRLFLGYNESKEDMFPEGFSDDEDSGIFQRGPDDYEDA